MAQERSLLAVSGEVALHDPKNQTYSYTGAGFRLLPYSLISEGIGAYEYKKH